jgi:hypothetical protein
MRQNLKDAVAVLAELLPFPEPIVELGAFQVDSQVGFADLRPFFPGRRYIGCDMRQGPGVDRLENLHRLTFADASVGSILCLDTLEHVANCHLAVAEMRRVLAPDGTLVLASVMDFEIHEFPADYWRFTPKAIEMLLREFETVRVYFQGDPQKPHTVLGIARRSRHALPPELDARLSNQVEPLVPIEPGLGADALVDETRAAVIHRQTADLETALARAHAELAEMRGSTTWRLAVALRDLPVLGAALRAAVRWLKKGRVAAAVPPVADRSGPPAVT